MQWRWIPPEPLAGPLNDHPLGTSAPTVLVMPVTDRDCGERSARQLCRQAGVADAELLLVAEDASQGRVDTLNRCFRASRSRHFGYVQQNAYGGKDWLQRALHTLEAETRAFIGFNDSEWRGLLATQGLGCREWLAGNYQGDLFCPDYTHHFADAELTLLAIDAQVYTHDPHAILIDIDWDGTRRGVNALDRALFAQRKRGWLQQRIHKPELMELFR